MTDFFSINLLLLIILLVSIQFTNCSIFKDIKNYFSPKEEEDYLNIFIATHKDFINYRYNPVYKIVAYNHSQLKNKYDLEVIYCDQENYKFKDYERAYGEMSKYYHIYNLYKTGKISSKYVGFSHYRRYFPFLDNIPDLDEIFKKYGVMVCQLDKPPNSMRYYYCRAHICKNFDEVLDIIKDIKPELYNDSLRVANENTFYTTNLFIMKKQDFLNYGKFMFDILFEFDKRHNFNTLDDVKKYLWNFFPDSRAKYQIRIQGFLSERIATMFYRIYFNDTRIKKYYWSKGNHTTPNKSSILAKFSNKKVKIKNFSKIRRLVILLIIQFIFVISFLFCILKFNNRKNKKNIHI